MNHWTVTINPGDNQFVKILMYPPIQDNYLVIRLVGSDRNWFSEHDANVIELREFMDKAITQWRDKERMVIVYPDRVMIPLLT